MCKQEKLGLNIHLQLYQKIYIYLRRYISIYIILATYLPFLSISISISCKITKSNSTHIYGFSNSNLSSPSLTCMHTHTHARTHTHAHTYTHTHAHAYTHTHAHARTRTPPLPSIPNRIRTAIQSQQQQCSISLLTSSRWKKVCFIGDVDFCNTVRCMQMPVHVSLLVSLHVSVALHNEGISHRCKL